MTAHQSTIVAAALERCSTASDAQISWRPVPGFEQFYEVSSAGSVRSVDRWITRIINGRAATHKARGRLMIPTVRACGRRRFQFYVNGVKSQHYAAALVLAAFVCLRPVGMEACHFDGNPGNDSLDNLRWGTPSENSADKRRHGTCFGHHNRPIPTEAVLQIKELRAAGMSQPRIAALTSVNESTVNKIINGKRRAQVTHRVAV